MNMRSGASAAAIILAASLTWASAAQAQENPDGASTTLAQAPQMPGMAGQQQGMQPGQSGMMGPGMGQGQGMMGQGMGQGMMGRGAGQSMADQSGFGHGRGWMKRRGLHQHLMKIMFAIADADGNGALSFNEVTEIHRRIFNAIDANKDGQITMDELRNFMPGS